MQGHLDVKIYVLRPLYCDRSQSSGPFGGNNVKKGLEEPTERRISQIGRRLDFCCGGGEYGNEPRIVFPVVFLNGVGSVCSSSSLQTQT